MTFNKSQKILTVLYFISLLSILLFLTPYTMFNIRPGEIGFGFGSFFRLVVPIVYTKLLIEIGILTIIYCLTLIMLKSKS